MWATSYVVARHLKHPEYTCTNDEADVVYDDGARNSVYALYNYSESFSKDYRGIPAGNNECGDPRTQLKTFIKDELSRGNPVLIPAKVGMSFDPNAYGHFYIIVYLSLTPTGTGSKVRVIDVLDGARRVYEYDYSRLLSSNWVNSDPREGWRTYSALVIR